MKTKRKTRQTEIERIAKNVTSVLDEHGLIYVISVFDGDNAQQLFIVNANIHQMVSSVADILEKVNE